MVKYNKFLALFLAFLLLIAPLAPAFASSEEPAETEAAESSEEENTDLTYYRAATAIAAYWNKAALEGEADIQSVPLGNAGGLLGYLDVSIGFKDKIVDAITSSVSQASKQQGFDFLEQASDGAYHYARYGAVLSQMGLDKTGTDSPDLLRSLQGMLMTVMYFGSLAVPVVFGAMIKALKFLNPFNWFSNIWTNVPDNGALGGLKALVTDIYSAIDSLAWTVVVPLFFAALIFILVMSRDMEKKRSTVKKYIFRVAFLVIGIPLMASLYTSALNSMEDIVSAENSPANGVIASTFVDFESWVKGGRLAVPSDAYIRSSSVAANNAGQPSDGSYLNLRKTAAAINRASGSIQSSFGASTNTVDWNNQIGQSTTGDFNRENMNKALDLMASYRTGKKYDAASWETDTKSYISIKDEMEKMKDPAAVEDNIGEIRSSNTSIYGNGGLRAGYSGDAEPSLSYTDSGAGLMGPNNGLNPSNQMGLSTMAMYNYLNTRFDDAGITTYSPVKSSSGFVRSAHYSVNIIGTGAMSGFYYMSSIVMLLCISILGFAFAFGMFFANVKRTMAAISNIPMGMLGSVRAIAASLTYVFVMITEIIGTMFLYTVAISLVMSVPSIIESPIRMFLEGSGSGVPEGGAPGLIGVDPLAISDSPGVAIFGIIGCIVLSYFIVKYGIKYGNKVRQSYIGLLEQKLGVVKYE